MKRAGLVVKKSKQAACALVAAAVFAVIAAGCTFTGAEREPVSPPDEWFVEEAWRHAEPFAQASASVVSKSDVVVLRHADDISVDVAFTESGGKRSVSVSFARAEDGQWAVIPANAVNLLDPERWGLGLDILVQVENDLPYAVVDYAKEYVAQQIDYYNGLGVSPLPGGSGQYAVVDARIIGLTGVNTGTAALSHGVGMYLLEYRLLVDHPDNVVLAGGTTMEEADGERWITERSSVGQPYLLLAWDDSGIQTVWQPVCVTNTDHIMQDYGTPEMLERYGNEFTAAAMEMYIRSDAYPDTSVRTIGQVTKVYRLSRDLGHTAVAEIAETMTTWLLDDLKDEGADRTFTLLDWRDLNLRADRMYDAWVVTGEVNVKFEGVLSPVGDSSLLPEGEYVNVSLGEWRLRHINGEYVLAAPAPGEQLSATLVAPLLTPDTSVGVGVILDYVDDQTLVFHGYFGLFVYDFEERAITFSADLKSAVGTTIIQGSEGAAVRASADGSVVHLFFYPERSEPEPLMAYAINPRTGEYNYGPYEPLDPDDAFKRQDYGCDMFSWGTLGELTYTDERGAWLVFADWNWAD